jgi:two-component system NarL family response regulator
MGNLRIKVMLVDDHSIVRTGLATIINLEDDMAVVCEAADAKEALERFKACLPDVVLMDLRIPGTDGVQVAAELISRHQAKVAMLTTYDDPYDIQRAMAAGAKGYLLKNVSADELVAAIRAIHSGGIHIPTNVASKIAGKMALPDLTEREVEVLRLVVKGRSNKEIASELHFTDHTAKAHLKNILQKLGVADRTEAAVMAVQRGIISLQ